MVLPYPLVILFCEQRAGDADDGGVVGEDPDDVGAAADLEVDALEPVRGLQLASARGGEGVEASRSSSAASSRRATFGAIGSSRAMTVVMRSRRPRRSRR
jgi:hypothetical protein